MGKSSSAQKSAGRAAEAQSDLAQQLISQSDPTRNLLFKSANDFLRGGNVFDLPQFAAVKDSVESQFSRARDSVIGNTATGGGLTDALASLEGDRASALAEGAGALADSETNRALQLATFGAAQGTQGLQGAGAVQASRAGTEANQNAAKMGLTASIHSDMADFAGEAMGSKKGGG